MVFFIKALIMKNNINTNNANTETIDDVKAKYVNPHDRFFGRRAGQRLSSRKQMLLTDYLPKWRLDLKRGGGLFSGAGGLTSGDVVAGARELWLEIGFGKGENLVYQAQHNPQIAMIGCEPFINGVAALMDKILDQQVSNIRIHDDDARLVLDHLADASVARVFLIHPDPWPKKRHAQRRFVNPPALDRISRVLKSGSEIWIATDHPVYREWTLMQMALRQDFEWTAEQPSDWRQRPDNLPITRYCEKALEGDAVYLIYRKK